MKRDPYVNPLELGKPPKGGWKFTAENGFSMTEQNFWALANRVLAYRKANKIGKTDFERIQTEILLTNRRRLGLNVTTMIPEAPEPGKLSNVQAYLSKRIGKPKGGCRGCGQ